MYLFSCFVPASDDVINIVTYGDNSVIEQYVERLQISYKHKFNKIDLEEHAIENSDGIYITIGEKALINIINQKIKKPILAVFIKKNSFHHIIKAAIHNNLAIGQVVNFNNIGAIYSDPPLKKQMELISYIFGESASIGVITSPITDFMQKEISRQAKTNKLSVEFISYNGKDNINKTINTLREQDVLLAIPDNLVWNTKTLKNIILSTYRNKQPIVGFSRSLVSAGSIGTYYSDLDHVVKETVDRIKIIKSRTPINFRLSPKYNALSTNKKVIRSLNLKQPTIKVL